VAACAKTHFRERPSATPALIVVVKNLRRDSMANPDLLFAQPIVSRTA